MRVTTSTKRKTYGRHWAKYKVTVQPDFDETINISFWAVAGKFFQPRYKRSEVLLPVRTARKLGLALLLATESPKAFVGPSALNWTVDEDKDANN
jgi:hypothetical protein